MSTISTTVLADNAYGTIAVALATTDTSLTFTTGHGARFPAVASPNVLYCCLLNSSNVLEEIQITAHTAGADTATIVRAAGGTSAKTWAVGDRIEARISNAVLDGITSFLQAGTGAVSETLQSILRYFGKSIISFGASASGTAAANTTAIQAAHDAAKNDIFQCVLWPAGTYAINALTFSPYVRHISLGRVVLQTTLASGSLITISDLYGNGSGITASGLTRSQCFIGDFYIQNTNAGNAARAFFIGGATAANYATQLVAMNGGVVTGFNGGVVQYGYNCFGIHWSDCFWYNNLTAGHISILAGATNVGENFTYTDCIFGGATGTNAGPLFDWNTVVAADHTFVGCSADYLSGLNKTGNAATKTKVTWLGGHLEWNTTTAPYLQNDGGMEWNIDGPLVTGPVIAFNNPYITDTSGTSTTRFINAKYVTPAGINTFHRLNSATAVGVFDYTPNYQGASGPTTFLNEANSAAKTGYAGMQERESIGGVATYSGAIGNGTIKQTYQRAGSMVTVTTTLTTGSTTTFNAGAVSINMPLQANANSDSTGVWWLNNFGIGNSVGFTTMLASGTAELLKDNTGAALQGATAGAWGVGSQLIVTITYFV